MRALVLALCLLMALPAAAADAKKQPALRKEFQLQYAMYTGGFDVVTVDGSFKHTASTYDLELLAYTKGLLGTLAPWKGELNTTGKYGKKGTYTPSKHRFSSWWRRKEERTTFLYDKSGNFKSMEIVEEDGNVINELPDPALAKGTHDMLTALAIMLKQYEKTGSCSVSVPSFDGKRRFLMKFTDTGDATIKPSRYSIYEGTARTCTIEIVPDGGLWHEKPRGWMTVQEQSKAGNKLPKLWIAKPAQDIPPVPVRFDVFTAYGNIVMHLTGVK
ncbi:MAG: DUF3108 domain-containing protein [Alphaproteobacteria bacterium]|nr:DUF3108 domain-containing protein [Alphaproteobacteria bacterium]